MNPELQVTRRDNILRPTLGELGMGKLHTAFILSAALLGGIAIAQRALPTATGPDGQSYRAVNPAVVQGIMSKMQSRLPVNSSKLDLQKGLNVCLADCAKLVDAESVTGKGCGEMKPDTKFDGVVTTECKKKTSISIPASAFIPQCEQACRDKFRY
ncbi:hypothetical protein [Sphingomonas sp. 28-62-11]|uniref:hypothetical protein n=1 Tax=Sphingomonas sp. 28-62-11 TaxID=1970432 RepID=UPI0035A936BC